MKHRLISAILMLYPRPVRRHHGPEITAVIDDLIAHEERSPARLYLRLAIDGLIQRAASTATAWTLVAALTTTSLGVLAVSDLSVANAHKVIMPRTRPTIVPTRGTHETHHPVPRTGIIVRRATARSSD